MNTHARISLIIFSLSLCRSRPSLLAQWDATEREAVLAFNAATIALTEVGGG